MPLLWFLFGAGSAAVVIWTVGTIRALRAPVTWREMLPRDDRGNLTVAGLMQQLDAIPNKSVAVEKDGKPIDWTLDIRRVAETCKTLLPRLEAYEQYVYDKEGEGWGEDVHADMQTIRSFNN